MKISPQTAAAMGKANAEMGLIKLTRNDWESFHGSRSGYVEYSQSYDTHFKPEPKTTNKPATNKTPVPLSITEVYVAFKTLPFDTAPLFRGAYVTLEGAIDAIYGKDSYLPKSVIKRHKQKIWDTPDKRGMIELVKILP